ncbi:hypothetical protein F5148DRAFT_454057 [Russula earlei]|uniref:Uncharacterized protein n=1 Tax=Russula earlei TaxID=71964 RepID=A0ACC0TYI9_9AGAM|nr:hypothetical protein F5148DRAFT_454057 [Russula earlei]
MTCVRDGQDPEEIQSKTLTHPPPPGVSLSSSRASCSSCRGASLSVWQSRSIRALSPLVRMYRPALHAPAPARTPRPHHLCPPQDFSRRCVSCWRSPSPLVLPRCPHRGSGSPRCGCLARIQGVRGRARRAGCRRGMAQRCTCVWRVPVLWGAEDEEVLRACGDEGMVKED